MKYEVVEISEKKVVGITARTRNSDADMPQIIGGLWQRFWTDGIYQSISHKQNDCSIGLYSNYENDVNGAYDITVCCEVSELDHLPSGVEAKIISSGKYAKFVVHGHMQHAVGEFWTKLWGMNLDRRYGYDFEEYQSGGDMDNAEIHIYIAIN
ncbi:GyrI-like domain-containing protein [Paenibacillus segetis]|uniref:AraC family transcriptional regulator n=1 Tax=Paenibacillus segetis TaxID=1325360 RepID=A0ABQ1YK43_9BACL|nr:GyrI-like domain-containing protein [Paenibacillus segetis]GGH29001.1 AraC family transcriptional regulator [Paenibacillus segetis]